MALHNITHFWNAQDCCDFLSTPNSYMVLYDLSSHKIELVVKLDSVYLFVKEIVTVTNQFSLNHITWFQSLEDLIDFYHENFIYDWSGSMVRRFKLDRPVYNKVCSLQHLAGVVVKKNKIPIPHPDLESVVSTKPVYF